jgi:hypothetical protein
VTVLRIFFPMRIHRWDEKRLENTLLKMTEFPNVKFPVNSAALLLLEIQLLGTTGTLSKQDVGCQILRLAGYKFSLVRGTKLPARTLRGYVSHGNHRAGGKPRRKGKQRNGSTVLLLQPTRNASAIHRSRQQNLKNPSERVK